MRARVTEGLSLAGSAKVNVSDIHASGNPQADPLGYQLGYTPPAATRNVTSVVIAAATGLITITTTANAGNGTVILTPNSPIGVVMPVGSAAFVPSQDAIAWRCMVTGSLPGAFVGTTAGTLAARFAPAECR